MLNIKFGEREPFEGMISAIFEGNYETEWFEDPFVLEMIKNVDGNEHVDGDVFRSPILGTIDASRLSGGVKTLIMLYKMPELEMIGSNCGDNCNGYILKIAEMQDITLKYAHLPEEWPEKFEARFVEWEGMPELVTHTHDEFIQAALQRLWR